MYEADAVDKKTVLTSRIMPYHEFMRYSQKYCLVSFLEPVIDGTEFAMTEWPLHVTLADAFAINLFETGIESKLVKLFKDFSVMSTRAKNEAVLGTTQVVLLEKSRELLRLHNSIIDILASEGAKFNTPEFTKEGFLPHCTIQKNVRLRIGDEVMLGAVALIDMFPDKNWRQRKVINTFGLAG